MVCTQWTCGFASTKQVPFSAGRDSEWSSRFRQACKAEAALCRGETAEKEEVERNKETELNGVEEERDEMSGEEGELTAKRSWQRQIGE